ncbi:DUF4097 family beta strand repeat-containing protein [Solilutibacter tolerans]|uniref:DUF4097 domain-containing protein n=1 Tax=Solilutibacter tolerans TaxID=1604334 RepID=A0A1N6QW73_9GAMM|nr:hypothetical protein [Lysobacter tolerans]SIQ20798.1 hypothetical protein SAMN05421546_0820 [Lysobacter tolerans]
MAIKSPLVLAIALTLATPAALALQNQSKVSDDIRVAAKSAVGNVDTVSGDIDLETGVRAGSVSTVSGDIDIDAGVTAKNVESVSGDIQGDADVQLGDAETVSGDIELGARGRAGSVQTVSGDIRFDNGGRLESTETVSGDVFINRDGRVARGVETVSGSVGLVASEVGGDIVTYTGDVTVGVGSHVRGGLTVRKPKKNGGITIVNLRVKQDPPRIIIGPNARVDGALTFEHEVKLYVHRTARIGKITGATPVYFDTPRAPAN